MFVYSLVCRFAAKHRRNKKQGRENLFFGIKYKYLILGKHKIVDYKISKYAGWFTYKVNII